ncbi:lymphoid-restricted membrane protein-like isoform X2 [Mizuhopecten yessoensis]|uniref:lymphoid-restricted membrane protein-like isoform X2 n=1 Tax=Mizuhopecten yessoensis TaxID=6573 RepID=UPI000B459F51|nr:lymphoid-restricted membrane protein-like isoform X2 [Mizuhopecten yessoensis]
MACNVQKVRVVDYPYPPGTTNDGYSFSPQMSDYPYPLLEKDHLCTPEILEKHYPVKLEMKKSSSSGVLDKNHPFSARLSEKKNPCSEVSLKNEDLCTPGPSDNGDCGYNSRPMTEEDLIDSLFYTCDVDHVGKVHIHRLIEYLKLTNSNISENDKDLKNLATMFDPQGIDTFIDLHKYRSTMKHWIESIRKQSFEGSQEDDVFSTDVCSTVTSGFTVNAVSPDSTTMTTPNYPAEIFSRVCQQEQMELQCRAEGLQHQNRRLLEENTKLQQQLDSQEDHLTAASTEKYRLARKIKSLQEIVDLKEILQTENEELRCANSRLQERRKDLENKLNQLEREKSLHDMHIIDLEHKLQTISGQVECLSIQKQDLHISNVENKHRMSQLLEVKNMQEVQLNERFNEVKNLQNEIKVMSKTMEELQQEKESVKLQNSQVQRELSSIQAKMETFTFHENSEISQEGENPKLYSCSTPLKASQSICMELKEMAMKDSGKLLPTPLCAKEYFEEVFADITPVLDHNFEEEEEEESLSEDLSASSKDDLTMEISKFADKYEEKQTKLLQEIDSYIQVEGQHKDTHMAEKFQRNLKSELDKMLQKVSTLAKAKELADNRLISLKMKLMKVSDENHQLKMAHQKSYELITEKGLGMELSVDNRLQVFKVTLDRERSYIKMLEKELAEKNQDVNVADHRDKCNTSGPSIEDLQEIAHLKRENLDLEEKCQNTEIKVQELEDTLGQSQEDLDTRNTQCDQLEENLSSCKLEHQLDLKEIWRLVHKDVEKECTDGQKEVPLSDTPYHIRNQITQEIQSLKTQLHKREAVLDILTSSKCKPDHHQTLEHSTCSCFGNVSGSNASSPLVEALTIDFFNGNQPLHRGRKGPCIASSEMDLSSGCSKCQDHMYNGWGYSSTPLGNRCPPQRQTSTESNNNNSQTNLCKSVSSSSTSGAADLDLSTSTFKSCDGKTRRKEFQTIRWESDDIVYQSSSSSFDKEHGHTEGHLDGNRTVDHNDNTTCEMLTPAANGLRRWSFNAAIANQNYASDDMVHYPRCRSQSFQAAIESGQQTPYDYKDNVGDSFRSPCYGNKYTKRNICICGDNTGSCAKCNARKGLPASDTLKQGGVQDASKHNGVFNLSKPGVLGSKHGIQTQSSEESEDSIHTGPIDDYCWNDNLDQNSHSSYSFSHLSYPTEYREPVNDSRSSPHLTRKLSILIEEDDTTSEAEVPRSPLHAPCGLTNGQLRDSPQKRHKRVDPTQGNKRVKTKRVCVSEGGLCGSPTKVHPTVAIVHHNSPSQGSSSNQRLKLSLVSPEREVCWQDKEKARERTDPLEDCRQDLPHSTVEPLQKATPTQSLTHRTPPQYLHRGVSPQRNSPGNGGVTEEDEHDLSITSALALHLGKLSLADSMSSNESTKPSRPPQLLQSSGKVPTSSQSVNRKDSPSKIDRPGDHQMTMPVINADHTQVKTDHKTVASPAKTDPNPSTTKESPVVAQTNTDQSMKDQNSSDSQTLAKSCKLAKIRQDHLNKKREQMKHVKMPELMETQEVGSLNGTTRPETNGGVVQPPPASNQPAFPSIPNSFLKTLKLNSDTVNGDDDGSEQASELEIEKKFTSLSLAFKTDKLTLEKRLEIQERSRDIAEQNVDTELKGLKDNLETLNQLCTDTQVRDVLRKIQTHLDILEQAAARVSSRAEVYGAVQQEKRMSKAIEIMITHVDTIRMVHERVNSELEEARKLLQDSRPFGSAGLEIGDFPHMSKRSLSLSQQGQGFQSRMKGRRVSEVAIPRALGGTGVPSFTHSTSMDPKSRFQCAVASMAMKNAVTDTFRRSSLTLGKQASVSGTPPKSRENSTESKEVPDKQPTKQNSKEEEAFQKGFQQGYKAQMGRELSSLREHQNSINQNLEELMDTYDSPPEEEERTFKEVVMEKIWDMVPEWEIAGKRLRMTLAGLVFFMALCSIIMSFLPLGQAIQVFTDYRHMDHPPL